MLTDEHEHAMKVAKVIAKAMGDNFSDAFKNKQRWTAKRGMSGGRFRDVNEPFQDDYIAAAQAAAAVIAADRAGLVAEIERLREENYRAFTDGMEAAAQICGSLAEVEYDDADGFDAATGCEAAIMRVVKDQRREQAALGVSHDADA